jgi:hypothetical protein
MLAAERSLATHMDNFVLFLPAETTAQLFHLLREQRPQAALLYLLQLAYQRVSSSSPCFKSGRSSNDKDSSPLPELLGSDWLSLSIDGPPSKQVVAAYSKQASTLASGKGQVCVHLLLVGISACRQSTVWPWQAWPEQQQCCRHSVQQIHTLGIVTRVANCVASVNRSAPVNACCMVCVQVPEGLLQVEYELILRIAAALRAALCAMATSTITSSPDPRYCMIIL